MMTIYIQLGYIKDKQKFEIYGGREGRGEKGKERGKQLKLEPRLFE